MAQMTVKDVIEKLKPNAYIDKHPIWNKVEKGLSKLSKGDLNNLWIVVSCKREEK